MKDLRKGEHYHTSLAERCLAFIVADHTTEQCSANNKGHYLTLSVPGELMASNFSNLYFFYLNLDISG
jgi:hypothetical protein